METQHQLPAPQPKHAQDLGAHPIVIVIASAIGCLWVTVLVVGVGESLGGWAAWWTFIVCGSLVALCVVSMAIQDRRKQGQLHKEDLKDREHHRKMIELAIHNDHSAEHITATSSFRAISKYMGPAGSLTIKDNVLGHSQLEAGAVSQPRLESIVDELTPNALEFAFGSNRETGDLVKNTLPKAIHLQAIGSTGFGKSRQATGILTQLVAKNDPAHLQLALLDCEGETSAPFWHLPHTQYVADEPKEAARILAALARELERRHISKQVFPVLLIFVEEFLTLRNRMPAALKDQALNDFTTLACGGRKRGVSLFTVGQTAYAEKSIRDAQNQFFSSMCFSAKPDMARAAGFRNTPLLNTLYAEKKQGQFLLESSAGDAILLAPHVPDKVSTLVESGSENGSMWQSLESSQKAGRNQVRNQSEDPLEARLEQVRQLLLSGVLNKGDIIQSVWGVKPGSSDKYRSAEEEYKVIMAQIAQKGRHHDE
jgi:hypothetical protein